MIRSIGMVWGKDKSNFCGVFVQKLFLPFLCCFLPVFCIFVHAFCAKLVESAGIEKAPRGGFLQYGICSAYQDMRIATLTRMVTSR